MLPFARAAQDAVTNARLAVDDPAGLVRGQVTVGMVSGCALPVLAELLAGCPRTATRASPSRWSRTTPTGWSSGSGTVGSTSP